MNGRWKQDGILRLCARLGCLALLMLQAACAHWSASRPLMQRSEALPSPASGSLSEGLAPIGAQLGPDDSAFWLLSRGTDALTARAVISDAAESSLDVQYFIWQPDETGRLLMQKLLAAADRGVRVRLLLDDIATNGLDRELVALDHHRNFEVRIFNPWRHRKWRLVKAMEFLLRWSGLNHRMHNKIYVADGEVAILGGRNVGNRYLGFYDSFMQNDLDLMMAGSLVDEVSESFDLFWNSGLAYPAQALPVDDSPAQLLEQLRDEFAAVLERSGADFSPFIPERGALAAYWAARALDFQQGRGDLHFDLPYVEDAPPDQLYVDIREFISSARTEVLISSPYFVPDRDFVEQLGAMVSRGVRVVILTNSLASNNHTMAHTGYRHWRRAVLRKGVELYELRYDAEVKHEYAVDPDSVEVLGLHSKAVVVDGHSVFIGSPNIDPRSMRLNTELGVIVENEPLARQTAGLIERDIGGKNAWQVSLRGPGWLTWTSAEGTIKRQPAAGFRQRSTEFFLNLLPLKGQL
jgi:putative cardiolipin synthase